MNNNRLGETLTQGGKGSIYSFLKKVQKGTKKEKRIGENRRRIRIELQQVLNNGSSGEEGGVLEKRTGKKVRRTASLKGGKKDVQGPLIRPTTRSEKIQPEKKTLRVKTTQTPERSISTRGGRCWLKKTKS